MAIPGGNVVQIILDAKNNSNPAFKGMNANLAQMASMAKTALPLVTAAASAAAAGFAVMTKAEIDNADALGKLAQKAGASVEFLGALVKSGDLAGVTFEGLEKSTKFLNEAIIKNSSAFSAMNISTRDATGTVRKIEEILPEVADRFADLADGAEKAKLAEELFGREGLKMIPLLNQGSKALEEQRAQFDRWGLTVTREGAKASEEFNDNLTKLAMIGKGVANTFAMQVTPGFAALTAEIIRLNTATGASKALGKVLGEVAKFQMSYVVGAMTPLIGKDRMREMIQKIYGNEPIEGEAEVKMGPTITGPSPSFEGHPEETKSNFQAQIDLQNQMIEATLQGARAIEFAELHRYQNRIKQIGEIVVSEEQAIDMLTYAQQEHHEMVLLNKEKILAMDRNIHEMRQAYDAMHLESTRGLYSYIAEASTSIHAGLSSTLTDVIMGAQDAKEAFAALGRQMVQMVVNFMAQRSVAWALEKVLAGIGAGVMKASAAAAIATASGVAAAWAAAATASAIATGGSTLAAAAGVPTLMATNAALGSSIALAGSLGGIAHGGMDYVPSESTYLLNRGERVLSPNQNEALMEFLDGSGGGGRGLTHFHINVDGKEFLDFIHDASASGSLTIRSKAIVT